MLLALTPVFLAQISPSPLWLKEHIAPASVGALPADNNGLIPHLLSA